MLLEGERQRVAALRQMQIESEQFRYFEDQLRRQELANRRGQVEQMVESSSAIVAQLIMLTWLISIIWIVCVFRWRV